MKNAVIAIAALTVLATPAYAQSESNFGGLKVGVTAGYDSTRLELDGESGSKGGFLYGVTAGYDLDLGTVVLGVEAELSDSTTKETVSSVFVANDQASLSADRDLYVGARLGFAATDNILIYAKGGYTNARAKLSYTSGTTGLSEGDNLDGYRIGAGAEYAMGSTFGRLEYRYSDYGSYTFDGFNTGIEASRHQVVVAAGVRF